MSSAVTTTATGTTSSGLCASGSGDQSTQPFPGPKRSGPSVSGPYRAIFFFALSIGSRMGDQEAVADWRDERIAELETEGAHARTCGHRGAGGQVATLTAQVAALTKQVAELMEKLGRNSRNSHLPPSSDPPGMRGQGGQGKGKQGTRKPGGQPGHGGARRTLLAPGEVDEVVDLYPSHCEGCADDHRGCTIRGASVPAGRCRPSSRTPRVALPRGSACPRCRHKTRARVRRGEDSGVTLRPAPDGAHRVSHGRLPREPPQDRSC